MKEKIKDLYYKITGPIFSKKFNCTDFTIISNNCFGGIIYRNNHLPYLTPTAGLFIMPQDYIKFIYNLKFYLNISPIEITIEKSKYSKYLKSINYTGTIGKIKDIEIMFLHYKNFEVAKDKWLKRSKRINYKKIIYKFNDQNGCTINELELFNNFNVPNKILFTAKKYKGIDSFVLNQYSKNGYVVDDTKRKNTKKVFDIYKYVNKTFGGKNESK